MVKRTDSKKNSKRNRYYTISLLVSLVLIVTIVGISAGTGPSSSGTIQPKSVKITASEKVNVQLLSQQPTLTSNKLKELKDLLGNVSASGPNVSMASPPTGPAGGAETNVRNLQNNPGTFHLFVNNGIGNIVPSGYKATVNEPAVGANGKRVFYTGNWYAALSTNGGSTFSYINPFADMANFCCDQDAIYDDTRDMLIWYRMALPSDGSFKLGVSDTGTSWTFYTYSPANMGIANGWFDYPYITLSDNYMYVATNIFDKTSGGWLGTAMIKLDLNALKSGAGLSGWIYSTTSNFDFTPVNGAHDVMYWASHNSNSNMRIFTWDDATNSIHYYDRDIAAWSPTGRGTSHCAGPDGYNWCSRTDDRITSGWLASGTVGFFWNVKEGNGFTYPYVESATFNTADLSYKGRPFIWSGSGAWQYGAIYPNIRQDLGLSAFYGGGSMYPSHAVGIYDSYTPNPPPGWEVYLTQVGTNGPGDSNWGDYLRVRPYYPSAYTWSATGYTMQGGSDGNHVDPHYIVFGREQDNPLGGRSGGPDGFGYTFSDSNVPNSGINYAWTDISATGASVAFPNTDDSFASIHTGFPFDFYGTSYSDTYVGTNGILGFGAGITNFGNEPIGSSGPHSFIAPHWDDLIMGPNSAVYYQTVGSAPNRKLIIEYNNVYHFGYTPAAVKSSSSKGPEISPMSTTPSGETFEVILNEGSNDIKVQYKNVVFGYPDLDHGASATVGIEKSDGTTGLQYSYNERVLGTELAVLFKHPVINSGSATFSMNRYNMRSTTSMVIPLNVNTTVPIGSASLRVSYNPSVVKVDNAVAGSSASGSIFTANIDNNTGRVDIGIVSTSGIEVNGSVADLTFRAVATSAAATDLVPLVIDLTDPSNNHISSSVTNGNITVYTRIKGDVNDDGRITAADSLLYLRYSVGQDISPYHIDPATDDVTCDGRITASDALLVLRKATGQNVNFC